MLRKRIFGLSVLLSILSIGLTVLINLNIAETYLRADGKTKALFGLIELVRFNYQYFVLAIGITSLLLVLINWQAITTKKYLALVLGIIACGILFLRIWRLFVS